MDGEDHAGIKRSYPASLEILPCREPPASYLESKHPPPRQEAMMKTAWKEPKLEDLLADPILDVLLAHDRISRADLHQVVERARRALALSPRAWKLDEAACQAPPGMVKAHPRDFATC
jgi:hypothetical protein